MNKVGDRFDIWGSFGLRPIDNGRYFELSNHACVSKYYVKLILRRIDPYILGVHNCNYFKERPVIYIPFFIGKYRIDID